MVFANQEKNRKSWVSGGGIGAGGGRGGGGSKGGGGGGDNGSSSENWKTVFLPHMNTKFESVSVMLLVKIWTKAISWSRWFNSSSSLHS